jgi:hypothetical protein
MSAETMAGWVAQSRAASNVPVKVEDLGTLLQVASMVMAARSQHEGGGRRARAS